MGMAEMAQALFTRHLSHNPADPAWANRDRFVPSNGHASMLLYAALHLTGYDLPMDELRNFRQLHSRYPGHPEVGVAPGIETTTGPLGQGLANAVGMALASKVGAEFNRPGHTVVDHHTYAFVGDGCLMEGISHEVCSLAGMLRLSKLIVLYDDNGISIDGNVESWFADDTARRFEAYGWNIVRVADGHDVDAVDQAIAQARRMGAADHRPTLVICRTVIGQGAPNVAGTDKVHGSPLGAAEIAATRAALPWPHAPFEIPESVYRGWDMREAGVAAQSQWQKTFDAYAAQYPAEAAEFVRRMRAVIFPLVSPTPRARCWSPSTAAPKQSQPARPRSKPLPRWLNCCRKCWGGSADLTGLNLPTGRARCLCAPPVPASSLVAISTTAIRN